ncbi:type II 3-dehydroquinate dehydratase [Tomitella gaofuii]|uniref:type II 3-dehydroquinate dehydratase n=1 Tax=Tomitella gaofuii TaxID=2760083 RepID=UPI0015FD0C38|nr:type II 3-dehydroquinate dehydratase [Tomitella gaofuii]
MVGPIVVLNGPNLNLLGQRNPEVYGRATLADAESSARAAAACGDRKAEFFQTNHEGEFIDRIHAERGRASGIVINAGGLSHTSIALRDAVEASTCPVVEVHVSNIHGREAYRRHSYISEVVDGVIVGLGIAGYALAVRALLTLGDADAAEGTQAR